MMVDYFDAFEADFAAYYRTDLREALWGQDRVGVRRLWAMVRGLPVESAIARRLLATEEAPKPATQSEMARFFGGNVVVSGDA